MDNNSSVSSSDCINHPSGCSCSKCCSSNQPCKKCGVVGCMCGAQCDRCGGATCQCEARHCVSWSSIFAGAIVGLGLGFLFTLFNIAIGLKSFNNTADGATVFLVGGFVGLVVGTFVSMFAAGWTAGRLARRPGLNPRKLDLIYGFSAWTVSLVLSVFLAAHMGSFVMSHTNVLSNPNASFVMVTNDSAPIVTVNNDSVGTVVAMNKAKTDQLATTTFITFFMFFFGALSSCFGAHCGLSWCRSEKMNCKK
jgi:hypothetical protein